MSTPLAVILLAYAISAGLWGDRALARASWPVAHPKHGLRAWATLAASCYLSLAAVLLLVSHDVLEHALMWALHADKAELHGQYAGVSPFDLAWNGAAVVLLGLTLAALSLAACHALKTRRSRRTLRGMLIGPQELVDDTLVWVVPGGHPGAWCTPGRHQAVIVTDTALRTLDRAALRGLVAHEVAHLHRHHHAAVAAATIVGRLARPVGLLGNLEGQVRGLVEMEADDYAIERHGRRPLLQALLATGSDHIGPATLAADGADIGARVQRLVGSRETIGGPPSATRIAVMSLCAALVVVTPVAALFLPGLLVAGSAHG